MSGGFEIEMSFEAADGDDVSDPAGFEEFLDAVADEFEKIGYDVDYTAFASEGRAIWTIDVEDGTEGSLIEALTVLQKALGAVGVEFEVGRYLGRHEVMSTRRLALA